MEEDLKKAVSGMGQDTARLLYKYLSRRKSNADMALKEGLRELAFSTPKGMCELSKSLGQLEELDTLLGEIKTQYVRKEPDA